MIIKSYVTSIATMLICSVMLMGQSCVDRGNESVRRVLTAVCPGVTVAFDHYDAVAAVGIIPERYMTNVELAKTQVTMMCSNPETETTVTALAKAAAAYNAVRLAIAQARSVETASTKPLIDRLERSVDELEKLRPEFKR